MDSKNTYQYFQSNNSSTSFDGSGSSAQTSEPFTSPYAGSKDVVTESTAPPPYTRYAMEQPRQSPQQQQTTLQPKTQIQNLRQTQPQTLRQPQPQAQAAHRALTNAQTRSVIPQQQQAQDYRYQMDPNQSYDGAYGYGQDGGRTRLGRERRHGGPLHMLLDDGMSNQNQQYQSRHDMYAQRQYGYADDMDYGFGRRRRGGRRGGGPLGLIIREISKRV